MCEAFITNNCIYHSRKDADRSIFEADENQMTGIFRLHCVVDRHAATLATRLLLTNDLVHVK